MATKSVFYLTENTETASVLVKSVVFCIFLTLFRYQRKIIADGGNTAAIFEIVTMACGVKKKRELQHACSDKVSNR